MTALDIFRECAAADEQIARTYERIERRKALATGCTTRPLSPDGGSFGSGDASARMLNYLADLQALEEDVARQKAELEAYRACCLYLADMLSPTHASVALRTYLEHQGTKAIAEEMKYSEATVRRYKRQVDDALALIEITHWDRRHVPMVALR